MIRHLLLTGLIFCLLLSAAHAQQSQRLTQDWEFLREDLSSAWEAVRPATEGSPESVPLWEKVTLPHCFNAKDAVDPDVNYYQGPGWYRTTLEIKNPYTQGRTLLHFDGAGQKTDVYIYTTLIAHHTGGYDEWTVDITDAIQQFLQSADAKRYNGKVPLEIRCSNARDAEMIPSSMSDFNVYGGLYRYLNLVYTPALSFEQLLIHPQVDAQGKTGVVQLRAAFHNPRHTEQATLDINILDPQKKIVQHLTQQVSLKDSILTLPAITIRKPLLWSPAQPQLYTVQASLKSTAGEATWSGHFGFRHFEFVTHGPFLLNGQRLLLQGTHRHEDHAGVAAAMTESMMREEMILMKEMGVNFIRLGHYQQSRIILNLCDSLGILVW